MLEYGPIEGEQLKMMNELQTIVDTKYAHVYDSFTVSKEDNIITMQIVCSEEPFEVEEIDVAPTVNDIDLILLEGVTDHLSDLGRNVLTENLFTGAMPLELGIHLLQCAVAEDKAANADIEKANPNGRSLSLMLVAMDDMGLLVFQQRSDMVYLLSLVMGTWISEDKHLLDYFYSRKTTKRVQEKVEAYKCAIQDWLDALE